MVGKIRRVKSFHEAGHAVIARVLEIQVSGVAMRPAGLDNTAGVETVPASWLARNSGTAEQVFACENDAIVAFAGMAAQARSHPDLSVKIDNPEFQGDIENARRFVANIVRALSGERVLENERSPPLSGEDLRRAKVKFDELLQRTYALVDEHWQAIQRVARALETHDRIDQAELDELIDRVRRLATAHSQSVRGPSR
jgi:hypothetical protein